MADIHVPHLEKDAEETAAVIGARSAAAAETAARRGHRPRSLVTIGLEVLLISLGVFLGLMGEQWRENSRHRELATASLQRFRAEIVANREQVLKVRDYHAELKQSVDAYLAAPPRTRPSLVLKFHGLQPVHFEHTAWDLALVTQSLGFLDQDLAFALSRIHTSETEYDQLTTGVTQAMYLRPPTENVEAFLASADIYFGDIVLIEPGLVAQYDAVLPQLDRALGRPAG